MPENRPIPLESSILHQLLDKSPVALFILTLEGKFHSWSLGAEHVFDYLDQEVLDRRVNYLIAPESGREEAKSVLAEPGQGGLRVSVAVRRRKVGALIHVRATMRRRNSPATGPCVSVCEKDITFLMHCQDKAAVEAKSSDLLEDAPNAMIVVGQDGRSMLVNAQTENLFGYGREELIGQSVEMLMPERYRKQDPEHRTGFFSDPRASPLDQGNHTVNPVDFTQFSESEAQLGRIWLLLNKQPSGKE